MSAKLVQAGLLVTIAVLSGAADTWSLQDPPRPDTEIYEIGIDGSGRRDLSMSALPDMHPVVSPDARWIAFQRNQDIWVMSTTGTEQRQLTFGPHYKGAPNWAPDSRALTFEELNDDLCPPGGRLCAFWEIGITGSGGQRIIRRGSSPKFSPKSRTIVFEDRPVDGRPSAISTVRARGDRYRLLERHDGIDPAWSPDGKRIAYVRGNFIWVMNADGSRKRRLTSSRLGSEPVWSPRGGKLAYLGRAYPGADWGVFIVGSDGGRPRRVATDPVQSSWTWPVAWSPDGRRLAILKSVPNELNQLFVVDANGRGLHRVTNERGNITSGPAWSRSGRRLFYAAEAGG